MAGPVALILAVLLVVIATSAATTLLGPEGRLDAVVTAGVLGTTFVMTSVVAAGAAGVLRPSVLVLAHAFQAAASVGLAARRGTLPRAQSLLGAVPSPAQLRAAPWGTALVVLGAIALGWQLLVGLVLEPYAYAALTYHLPNVAWWVRTESLAATPLSQCCAYYPLNAEAVLAWPVVLLRSDGLVGTVQVVAALLCGAATAGIARTAGLDRSAAAAAGALLVVTPVLLAQAPTPYVDVLLAALVLAGLHGLARLAVTGRLMRLIVPALCAGLLTGTKGTGPLWAVALVLTATVVLVRLVRRGRTARAPASGAVAALAGTCVLLGGWWYVRSAVATGNPLYPFSVRFAGYIVFDGSIALSDVLTAPNAGAGQPWPVAVLRSWAADLLAWRHGSYDYQQRSGGLGPAWAWLGAPLLVPLTVRWWRRRNAALVALLPVLGVLLVQPYRWWGRFTLPLAALGAIGVVVAVERLGSGVLRRALQTLVLVFATTGVTLVVVEVDPASRAVPLPARGVVDLIGSPVQDRTVGRLFFPEYAFLDQVPPDATVVVDLGAEPVRFVYPLFGHTLSRRVVPAGSGPVPEHAWVVTSRDRPLAVQLRRERGAPARDVGGVAVWAPTRTPPTHYGSTGVGPSLLCDACVATASSLAARSGAERPRAAGLRPRAHRR